MMRSVSAGPGSGDRVFIASLWGCVVNRGLTGGGPCVCSDSGVLDAEGAERAQSAAEKRPSGRPFFLCASLCALCVKGWKGVQTAAVPVRPGFGGGVRGQRGLTGGPGVCWEPGNLDAEGTEGGAECRREAPFGGWSFFLCATLRVALRPLRPGVEGRPECGGSGSSPVLAAVAAISFSIRYLCSENANAERFCACRVHTQAKHEDDGGQTARAPRQVAITGNVLRTITPGWHGMSAKESDISAL